MLFVGEKYGYLSLPKPMVSSFVHFRMFFIQNSVALLLPIATQLPIIDIKKRILNVDCS